MKRYLVFAGQSYYPKGGWDDLAGSADTLDEAKEVVAQADRNDYRGIDWHQIVDAETGTVVVRTHELDW